ncbi:MAG TPA: GNAT family N-acetyltransferase [Umezawaea sp.]|nr:GNAT family N-acetyltransferase [Umezawaea sp.]
MLRPARPDQLPEVLALLEEASAWLRGRGITTQWPERFNPASLEPAIARTETWLVLLGGTIAGTTTLTWSDPLWADVGGHAGYVHRLATRRGGPGLGAVVLAWAADVTRRFGRRSLRLDCAADNPGLREYYEKAGFTDRGDTTHNGTTVTRYELPL